MTEERTAQSRQQLQPVYKKRRMIALAAAAAVVLLIAVLIIVLSGGGEPSTDPIVIGPFKPASPLDIKPLYATYDYSQPVAAGTAVEDSWFDDALIIGDSRADGLRLYGIIPGADIAGSSSAGVTGVLERTFTVGEDQTTLSALLSSRAYGKVYIMLGVNEVSWLASVDFKASYAALIDAVKAAQPEAAIYVQSLIPVSASRGWSESIAAYNNAIQDVARQKNVYFVDVFEAYADETGSLAAAHDAGDGVNLAVNAYGIWFDYLKTHTVNREMYKN